jgi:hypothetical protein
MVGWPFNNFGGAVLGAKNPRHFVWLMTLLVLLLSACASNRGPQAGQRYAILYTGGSRRAEAIFPVQIYHLDGKEISSDNQSRHIEPGIHTIKARGIVDRNLVAGLRTDPSRANNARLVFNFQSGRRYFIGVIADSDRRAEWRLVVWKTEDIDAGTLDFD